jgi:hypothetical protein
MPERARYNQPDNLRNVTVIKVAPQEYHLLAGRASMIAHAGLQVALPQLRALSDHTVHRHPAKHNSDQFFS